MIPPSMLARLAVHTVKGIHVAPEAPSAKDSDQRTTREVVEEAAQLTGEDSSDGAIAALQASGVVHAWQLRMVSADDWAAIGGCSLGLRMAIRKVLESGPAPLDDSDGGIVLTERLRNFLLMPGPNNEPPQQLCSCASVFMPLLLLPVEERQELLLIATELFSLISGLLVTIPLGFLRAHGNVGRYSEDIEKGWFVRPTVDDMMNAFGIVTCMCGFTAAMQSIIIGIWLLGVGRQADHRFYERLFSALAYVMAMIMALMAGTLIILWWYSLTLSTSSLVLPATAAVLAQPLAFAVTEHLKFFAECTALEFYHLPGWVKVQGAVWWPAGTVNYRGQYVLRDEVLRPWAEQRAAALRSRAGF